MHLQKHGFGTKVKRYIFIQQQKVNKAKAKKCHAFVNAFCVGSNRMRALSIQRDKSVWLLFLATVLLSGLFAFINLSEFVKIGIFKQTSGYPFGGEGPTPWYYKTPQLYATVNLTFGSIFFSALAFSCWSFLMVKRRSLFATLILTLLFILIQILTGQSD